MGRVFSFRRETCTLRICFVCLPGAAKPLIHHPTVVPYFGLWAAGSSHTDDPANLIFHSRKVYALLCRSLGLHCIVYIVGSFDWFMHGANAHRSHHVLN